MQFFRKLVPSPIGDWYLYASESAIIGCYSQSHREPLSPAVELETPILSEASRQLTEYFQGSRTAFDLLLEPEGTEFQRNVWQMLQTITFGSTISYGELAAKMGDAKLSRAVGAANGANPISIIIPCHRVVASNGHLTGYAGGIEIKKFLIDFENPLM